jgi:hypothetical protein
MLNEGSTNRFMTSARKPIILFLGGGDYGHIPRTHLCILSCIVYPGLVISKYECWPDVGFWPGYYPVSKTGHEIINTSSEK